MPKHFYPIMISVLLGTFILFLIWSAFQASTQGTDITDRDYYSKGLKYNSTQLEKRAAISMGWSMSTELDGGQLRIKLEDSKGLAVTGALGQISFSRPDTGSLRISLTEVAAGQYRAQLPASLKGEFTIRVEFERAGARLNRQLLINI